MNVTLIKQVLLAAALAAGQGKGKAKVGGLAPAAGGAAPSVAAQSERTTALTLMDAWRLDDALNEASKAIADSPKWGEAYFTRAQIYLAKAGPKSDLATINKEAGGVDYAQMADALKNAAQDLETFVQLTPDLLGKQQAIEFIGEVHAREVAANTAREHVSTREAKAAADAEAARKAAEAEAARKAAEAEAARKAAEEKKRQEAEAEAARQKQEGERQKAIAEDNQRKQAWDEDRDSRDSWRSFGDTLIVTGIVAGVGTGAVMYLGHHQNDNIKNGTFNTVSDITSADSTGKLYNTLAKVGGAVAGVGIVGGIVINVTHSDPGPYQSKLQVSLNPVIAPEVMGAVATARF